MAAKALVCSNELWNFSLFSSEYTKYAGNGEFPKISIFYCTKIDVFH